RCGEVTDFLLILLRLSTGLVWYTSRTSRDVRPESAKCGQSGIDQVAVTNRNFMSTRPSTTLADLLRPPLVANPCSTMRASLRRRCGQGAERGGADVGQRVCRQR